ncbi:MAG: VPLPA-CTERM sorting domain-containing protein [Phycisphaerae bacterium]|jgi:hypothetical protein|nr:VPLPA-CTERM sorting domain-containing protein [Phycisphaerae bacterium]
MDRKSFIVAGAVGSMFAAAFIASSASAENWTLTFTGLGPAKVVSANYNNARTFNAGPVSSYNSYWAGEMKWKNAQGKQFKTYCTQVNEHINFNQTVTYQQVALEQVPDSPPAPGPMGAYKATVLRDLYSRFYHSVKASGSDTMNAAFQCLVWEITHENTTAQSAAGVLGQLNLGLGAFQLNGSGNNNVGVFSTANAMLAELGGSNNDDFRFFNNGDNLRGLRHDTAQDQILVVPIPAPALMAAAGLVGLGIWRRRRANAA